jgi:hypothetical protein
MATPSLVGSRLASRGAIRATEPRTIARPAIRLSTLLRTPNPIPKS